MAKLQISLSLYLSLRLSRSDSSLAFAISYNCVGDCVFLFWVGVAVSAPAV